MLLVVVQFKYPLTIRLHNTHPYLYIILNYNTNAAEYSNGVFKISLKQKILLAPNVPKCYCLPVDKMINEKPTTIII